MLEVETNQNSTQDVVANLVMTALEQRRLSGLSEVLRLIAEATNAYGCILWQVVPGTDLQSDPPNGRLFVLDQWMPGTHPLLMHNLPVIGSIVGEAAYTGETINVEDVPNDHRVYTTNSWVPNAGIQSMCATPIKLNDENNKSVVGVLSLYRNTFQPFGESDLDRMKQLACLVPALYSAIRDRVSQDLLRRVNGYLHQADLRAATASLSKEDMKMVFRQVCEAVADTFQCLEASIFLEDSVGEEVLYQLMETTWPDFIPQWKSAYQPSEQEGLTGWVLKHGQSVKIFDLLHFKDDTVAIRKEYSNLTWKDGLDLEKALRHKLGLKPETTLQPLSFMAAPIKTGGKVLGALRCSTAARGPYYFAGYELSLLELVAAQLSRFWSNWLTQRGLEEEARAWSTTVERVTKMNNLVLRELSQRVPNEKKIFSELLKVIPMVIPDTAYSGIRLFDSQSNDLHYEVLDGDFWATLSRKERERQLERRFPVGYPPTSAGAYAFQRKEVYVMQDVDTDPYYARDKIMGTKRAIIAPIQIGNEVFGVLDIRRIVGSPPFPSYVKNIAALLSQRLGLYHYLATTIGELRKAQSAMENQVATQTQTYEDLSHQLKTPIIQAYNRANFLLAGYHSPREVQDNLKTIRSLCRKAKRVTTSLRLFADLARGESIPIVTRRLEYGDLIKLLSEAVPDSELMVDPNRRIRFHVDILSFEVLYKKTVLVDVELLEQAINNLLDNAGKYSYPDSEVKIYGGLTKSNEFFLSVANEGLPIYPHEAKKAVERGWRGDEALWSTGEGSGIGLWIVENIMQALRGRLEVIPTTTNDITQVRLLFRVTKD